MGRAPVCYAPGAFGGCAVGAAGAPGALGAVGAAGEAGAGAWEAASSIPSVEVLQKGHLEGSCPATRLMRFPHEGHTTGGSSVSAGLKHMAVPFSLGLILRSNPYLT